MSNKIRTLALTLLALVAQAAHAQLVVQENFTDGATTNSWLPFLGACLTAGNISGGTGPTGDVTPIPPCITATSPMTATSYYSGQVIPGGHNSPMTGGNTGNLPDGIGYGALRLTNAYASGTNNGFQEAGAIISNFTYDVSNGLTVVFTTYTYEGNSGGSGGDGADGMSFFLLNGNTTPYDVGAFGGSLGYTCSNANDDTKLHPDGTVRGYDGMRGGLIGLGIDEYGNFLNAGDNTASGFGYQWGRIGLRGAGSITLGDLEFMSPANYPIGLGLNYLCAGYTNCGAKAVQYACETGYQWNFSNPLAPVETSTPINDYLAVAGGYKVLSSTIKLANESATTRGQAMPITYKLQIQAASSTSPVPLLSFWYSLNGGAWQTVLTNQNLFTASGLTSTQWGNATANGVYFGFAGSSGGSNNVHEILCFQAAPAQQSASSVSLNQKQTAQVQIGTQVYFASYNTQTYAGDLTANNLVASVNSSGITNVTISPTANWDGSCVLTGGACAATGTTSGAAEAPTARVIMTYNPTSQVGEPFEWNNLNATQTAALEQGDTANCSGNTSAPCRLNFLRGDRTNEVNASGVGLYRNRPSVLGDIVDSSPTWVGAPSAAFPTTFSDLLTKSDTNVTNATDPLPENASSGSYAAYVAAQAGRLNVVYVGANDGLLHGFEAGSYSGSTYVSTYNDGKEILAYMPDFVTRDIHIAGSDEAENSTDFANPQYGHNFYVDGTPGTGDLYYNGAWHTWLVSGIGAGGPAIYALDITNPTNFTETSGVGGPATTVIGEWSTVTTVTDSAGDTNSTGGPGYGTTNALGTTNPTTTTTMVCANDTSSSKCGMSLGNTYGVPEIRRFHNGQWGAVFGNGTGSSTGAAGVFVMLVASNGSSPLPTISFYFLKVPGSATGNGIDYAVPVDLDGDHVTDYVYAGDKLGNIWRFDLTSSNPANWAAASAPLFSTGGQPITTNLVAVSVPTAGSTSNRLLLEFGTGSQTPFTVTNTTTYATGQQDLYGVWDWNMGGWNAVSSVQYASLSTGTTPVSYTTYPICGPQTGAATSGCTTSSASVNLTAQSVNSTGTFSNGTNYRTVSQNPVCWINSTACTPSTSDTSYGWYLPLPGANEQIIYSPNFEVGAFVVNTTIPTAAGTSCVVTPTTGYTMAISPATGGAFTNAFFGTAAGNFETVNGLVPSGVQLNGTGTPTNVTSGTSTFLVTQNIGGSGTVVPINPAVSTISKRLTWVEKR
jgi:type IV pilus assembly protein PilY1